MISTPVRSAARPAPWGLDLPLPGARAARTNVARLKGENIRYQGEGWGVDIPYMEADLVDLTPQDPLNIWKVGSYKVRVEAGQMGLGARQLNAMLQNLVHAPGSKLPLSKAQVSFGRNAFKLAGTARFWGLPLPFSLEAGVAAAGGSTVALKPSSVKLFGLPVLWAMKLFHVNAAGMLPGGMATMGQNYALNVDLAASGLFEGEIKRVSTTPEGLTVKIGAERGASLRGVRTDGAGNYCEVVADGEVALDSAVLRDAKVVIVDATPQDPYSLNRWDSEGYAKVERGQVVLDEARLQQKFMAATGAFKAESARLVGQDMVVKGKYEFLGFPFPVNFKLRFSAERGQLKMTPHDLHVVGIGLSAKTLLGTLKDLPGARLDGDGIVLDLKAASSVDMGYIREVKSEPGRLVLVHA